MTVDDRPHEPRSNVVPRGCVMFTVVLIIGIGVAGYFAFRHLETAFTIPAELERFEREDSVRALVRSTVPVAPTTTLDTEWIAFYVDGVSASGRALLAVRDALDSMQRAGRAIGDTGFTSILTSPSFFRSISVVEPATKRALTLFLNERGRSFDEYRWAKAHVVAATDITRATADSALAALIGPYLSKAMGSNLAFASRNTDQFFKQIDSIRNSGVITEAIRVEAMRSRSHLLRLGLGSLYGLDTEFDANSDEE